MTTITYPLPPQQQADPQKGEGEEWGYPGGEGEWGRLTWRRKGRKTVLEKISQTADGKFLLSPEAWYHWLWMESSRGETAEDKVNSRYSVTRWPLWRSLKQPSVPLSEILCVGGSNSARSITASDSTVEGHSSVWLLGLPDSSWDKPFSSASELFLFHCNYWV